MNVLLILNDPAYGTERSYNGLRLAGSLAKREDVEVRIFLIGDAVGCAMADQKVPERELDARRSTSSPNGRYGQRRW